MVTACELVLINVKNCPNGGMSDDGVGSNKASTNTSKKKRKLKLDLIVDVVIPNEASLFVSKNKW